MYTHFPFLRKNIDKFLLHIARTQNCHIHSCRLKMIHIVCMFVSFMSCLTIQVFKNAVMSWHKPVLLLKSMPFPMAT